MRTGDIIITASKETPKNAVEQQVRPSARHEERDCTDYTSAAD